MVSLFPSWKYRIQSKLSLDEINSTIDNMLIDARNKVIFYNFQFMWNDPKFIGKRNGAVFTAYVLSGKIDGTIRTEGVDNIVEVCIQARCFACATLLLFTVIMDAMFAAYLYQTIHQLPKFVGILCTFIPSAICYLIVVANLEQTVRRARQYMSEVLTCTNNV